MRLLSILFYCWPRLNELNTEGRPSIQIILLQKAFTSKKNSDKAASSQVTFYVMKSLFMFDMPFFKFIHIKSEGNKRVTMIRTLG